MAQVVWIGGTTAAAQAETYTPANVGIGDIFTLTFTGEDGSTKAVSFTATAATVANVTAGLMAAVNTSTHPLVTPVLATDQTTNVLITARTSGVPFYCAATTTDGNASNTQTLTRAVVTASSGPKDWNTALNWSTGSKPVASDDVTFSGRAVNDVVYGLDQSAITLTSLRITDAYAFALGTTSAKLKISATSVLIGEPASDGSNVGGSSLINLDLGTAATTTRIYKTRNNGTSGFPPVQIKAVNAANKLIVQSGRIGVSTAVPGEASTFSTIDLTGSGRIEVGAGVTLTTVNQTDGEIVTRSNVTTVNQDAGSFRTEGTCTITTANISGTFIGNSTGTITTLNVQGNGVADFTQRTDARTVTTGIVRSPNARINANNGVKLSVTWTNGILFTQGAITTQADLGDEVTATYA